MDGAYAEMVLTDRPPLHTGAQVERRWGIRAAEVGNITLPYFPVPIDYTNPNRGEALAQAEKATDQRWSEHELVILQRETAGRHEESEYIIATQAVLARAARMPALQRAVFMRRSPEVKYLRNGDQLAVGRGKTEDGTPRWLPGDVPDSEPYLEGYTMRRRAIKDDEGIFTVTKEGVLSYTSRGYNPAHFTGYAFPEEIAYKAALDAYNAAYGGTIGEIDIARQIRDAHAAALPARRRRLPSDVALNLALGRLLAADEAQTADDKAPPRQVYEGDTAANVPSIPAQRESPENQAADQPTGHP
jgi:hypothetical protein